MKLADCSKMSIDKVARIARCHENGFFMITSFDENKGLQGRISVPVEQHKGLRGSYQPYRLHCFPLYGLIRPGQVQPGAYNTL